MKVVICGSRTITDKRQVFNCIEAVDKETFDITEVVTGGARGVDNLGEEWAVHNFVKHTLFKADWKKDRKRAGLIRNRAMGEYCDAVIAIWDGESHGTKHMIDTAKELGKPCRVFKVKGQMEL